MKTIPGQILGGTRLDAHGERLSRAFLEKLCAQAGGRRFPMHQRHDMAQPTLGYIENMRVEPDPNNPGEYSLVGDITFDGTSVDEALKGFSISGVDELRPVAAANMLLYVPFPQYNNNSLIAELATDPALTIGKWIKKDAGASGVAVFGSTVAFLLGPLWADVYRSKVAPVVREFLHTHWPRLKAHGLSIEHVQIVDVAGHEVEIRFIPERGNESATLSEEKLVDAISKLRGFLKSDQRVQTVGLSRVVFLFDVARGEYKLYRTEYSDGYVDHHV